MNYDDYLNRLSSFFGEIDAQIAYTESVLGFAKSAKRWRDKTRIVALGPNNELTEYGITHAVRRFGGATIAYHYPDLYSLWINGAFQ